MSTITYAIVFSGDIVDGFQTISVKANVAKLLKADAGKMAALFSGKQVVIKRTTSKEEALRYGTALKKAGADVKIKALKSEGTPTAAPTRPAASAGTAPPAKAPQNATVQAPRAVATANLSLAPNVGNLVEPAPPAPPPKLDLSQFQVAENDGSPLVAPKPREVAQIDLSAFSVKENDGSPLVEATAKNVPKIEVPDFGLDEPGAVLDTIKEEKVLLNPDVSGISLAAVGSDLVDDTPEKPVTVPDTSKIKLVPNFDP